MKAEDVEQAVPLPVTTTTTTVVSPTKVITPTENKTLKEKLEDAKKSHSGIALYFAWFFLVIGKVGCDILSFIVSCIPIAMICMGAMHLKDCPACNFIPVYLLVGGILKLLNQFMNWMKCRSKMDESKDSPLKSKFTHCFDLFVIVWTIVGAVYVYKTYAPNYTDENSEDYCHKATYLFAFWLITSLFIVLGLILTVGCCCFVFVLCFSKDENE